MAAQELIVNNVQFSEASSLDEDDGEGYGGPVFENLDEGLQEAFLDYLEERRVVREF